MATALPRFYSIKSKPSDLTRHKNRLARLAIQGKLTDTEGRRRFNAINYILRAKKSGSIGRGRPPLMARINA